MKHEERLKELMRAFLEENKNINLSAFRTVEHCWVGNILDSLALLDAVSEEELGKITAILDIGTGGGFPLLPLAIEYPEVSCVGIDSTAKKIDAVKRISDVLGLKNITLHAGRLEDLAQDETLRESFDLVTARALAEIPVLLEYSAPFLKVGGFAAFWKSAKSAEELAWSSKAQQILHMPYNRTFEYDLGNQFGKRTIIFFKKIARTPKEYPRRTGIPTQRPL